MSDDRRPQQDDPRDVGADTEMFAAFQARGEPRPDLQPVGVPFRVLTLLGGLVLLVLLIWLLLR